MDGELLQQLERKKLIEDWARFTVDRLSKSLKKRRIGVTNSLYFSLYHKLIGIAGGDIGSVKHSFNYYGKFVDMGVGRGQKLDGVKSNADLRAIGSGGRKPKKWYSKTYYGEVAELRNLLANKYGEQAAGLIKEEIEKLNTLLK